MIEYYILFRAMGEHLLLAYGALLLTVMVALPLAIISLYSKKMAIAIIIFANIMEAIPSFAVVALVVPFLGIGFKPAIIAILLRTLLPIVKNTYTGLANTDKALIDSANGMGLTSGQILWRIRFPNAYPAFFAGLKFASILANSIAVLTAIIGAGGLGRLVFEGLSSFNISKLLVGALPAVAIAITVDLILTKIEKYQTS